MIIGHNSRILTATSEDPVQKKLTDTMRIGLLACCTLALLLTGRAIAQVPAERQPLPPMKIPDRGELVLAGDDVTYRPWSTDHNPDKVHIIQYFAGTMSASKTFEPFTDLLQGSFEEGSYHVTTIINLDAATWGTTGFVVSEVKANKRKFPLATMVLDEDGSGARQWELGKKGAGLAIIDREGIVAYFTRKALSDTELRAALELVGTLIRDNAVR